MLMYNGEVMFTHGILSQATSVVAQEGLTYHRIDVRYNPRSSNSDATHDAAAHEEESVYFCCPFFSASVCPKPTN